MAEEAPYPVALKVRVDRVRPSQNGKIVDATWYYVDDAGQDQVVLVDGFAVPGDATDDQIRDAVRARRKRVELETRQLVPDVAMNAGIVGQEVDL